MPRSGRVGFLVADGVVKPGNKKLLNQGSCNWLVHGDSNGGKQRGIFMFLQKMLEKDARGGVFQEGV